MSQPPIGLDLIIVGASTRAAALSAIAAGIRPCCGDLFADADLAARCYVAAVGDYPEGLAEWALALAPSDWIYTGALENHPKIVARIGARHRLLGNPPDVLRRVRDPFVLHAALSSDGFAVPDVRATPDGLPGDGSWMCKPRRGSAGAGVITWTGGTLPTMPHYFQQRIEGTSSAAAYVAAAGRARLLGVTRQLLMARSSDEPAFRYGGSVGPLPVAPAVARRLAEMGDVLAADFRLQGVFGVDFLDDGRDAWPVEVNPRYTASMELVERAMGRSIVALHVAACRNGQLPESTFATPVSGTDAYHAKRVLYTPRELVVDEWFARTALDAALAGENAEVADVPRAGTHLPAGSPAMTVFAAGATPEATSCALAERAAKWHERLQHCRTASGSRSS